jgi:hypothetical protein
LIIITNPRKLQNKESDRFFKLANQMLVIFRQHKRGGALQ